MDPATSKLCQACNQQVYPRDIRSDGICKSCSRKQYYQSRKDLLAQRYQNNREQRLLKQKEYYLKKRASQSATSTPNAPERSRRKPKQTQQPSEYEKETNGQPSSQATVIVEPQASSSSNASIHNELLNTPPSVVKTAYPFTTSADLNSVITTQPIQFVVGANGVQNLPYITWEMLNQQPTGHQNGRL